MSEFQELMDSPVQRREFLTRMSAAGLGVAAVGLLNGCGGGSNNGGIGNPTATPVGTGTPGATPTTAPGVDQTNFPGIIGRNINEVVLNYALSLEILEADLYRQALNAATGKALSTPLASNPDQYTLSVPAGALNSNSGQAVADAFTYLREFAFVEAAHRDFLRTAISAGGGTPQSPNPTGYKFPNGPGNDLRTILANILPLEETGVRAYLGAGTFLTDLNLLQTAVSIYSTEARHSAVVNYAIGNRPGPMFMPGDRLVTPRVPSQDTFEYFLPPATVLQRIRPFLA